MKTACPSRTSIVLIFALLMTAAFCARCAAVEPASQPLIFRPADLDIYDAEGKQLIGHASYRAQASEGGETIKGEYRYFDGQWDVEEERLRYSATESLPQMIEFKRTFYGVDRKMQRRTTVDLETGEASCEVFGDESNRSAGEIHSANLSFPADTFAGASLLIPFQTSLRDPARGRVKFHVFTCVPGPRVIAIDTPLNREASSWPLYAGGTAVKLEVQPDLGFGLFNLIAAPFLPKISAWFDPARQWDYAGGSNLRFYRGPRITVVRNITANPETGNGETIKSDAAVSPSLQRSQK